MGRVGAPSGLQGWVKIQTDPGVGLARFNRWWLGQKPKQTPKLTAASKTVLASKRIAKEKEQQETPQLDWLGWVWQELAVLDCEWRTENILVARLEGCTDRDSAARLRAGSIAIERSKFPVTQENEGEYYWVDLIGLSVKNNAGRVLGIIQSLMDVGPHHVLEIVSESTDTGTKKSSLLLIPFLAIYIEKVNISERYVQVNWSDDWLDENPKTASLDV